MEKKNDDRLEWKQSSSKNSFETSAVRTSIAQKETKKKHRIFLRNKNQNNTQKYYSVMKERKEIRCKT